MKTPYCRFLSMFSIIAAAIRVRFGFTSVVSFVKTAVLVGSEADVGS